MILEMALPEGGRSHIDLQSHGWSPRLSAFWCQARRYVTGGSRNYLAESAGSPGGRKAGTCGSRPCRRRCWPAAPSNMWTPHVLTTPRELEREVEFRCGGLTDDIESAFHPDYDPE